MSRLSIGRTINVTILTLVLVSLSSLPVQAKAGQEDNEKFCVARVQYEVARTINVVVTAYNSLPDQTDDTPFITASDKHVADGIVAINGMKFGTKVRFPDLFGDKVFVVEDRMHPRKGIYHADIWFESYDDAKNFGAKYTKIEVLTI